MLKFFGVLYQNRDVMSQESVYLNKAVQAHQQGQLQIAVNLYNQVLAINPRNFDALHLLGVIGQALGDYAQSETLIKKAIKIKRDVAMSYNNLAISQEHLGKFSEAEKNYGHAIRLDNHYFDAFYNKARLLHQTKKTKAALNCYQQALKIIPNEKDAMLNLGLVLIDLDQRETAYRHFQKLLDIHPSLIEAKYNFAVLSLEYGDNAGVEVALALADEILASKPEHLNTIKLKLQLLDKTEENLQEIVRLIESLDSMQLHSAEEFFSRGMIYYFNSAFDLALQDLKQAEKLSYLSLELYLNLANIYKHQQQYDLAHEYYTKALSFNRNDIEVLKSLAALHNKHRKFEKVIEILKQLIKLDSTDLSYVADMLIHKLFIADWTSYAEDREKISLSINNDGLFEPFYIIQTFDEPELHFKLLQNKQKQKADNAAIIHDRHSKIRVGFYSGDFYSHPVGFLILSLLKNIDTNKFQVYIFSNGQTKDKTTEKIHSLCEEFIDVNSCGDLTLKQLSREREIDIAIDLAGYTSNSCYSAFAKRLAPLQVNYLGYPGSLGNNCIDYIITDQHVIGEDNSEFYPENKVFMPNSYMPTNNTRDVASLDINRRDYNLPENAFVFASFNNTYKFTPDVFDVWMRLMSKVENSVLWLSMHSEIFAKNIQREAKARGVDPSRIFFANRVNDIGEHFARQGLADLFLDTWPYNGHTTTNDALWSGLPVLTYKGQAFAGRVSASVLNAIGLPELVTTSIEEYEELALELSTNPEKLNNIKRRLKENINTTPLFDTEGYSKNLERALELMYEKHHNGHKPSDIDVAAG